jgi:hypothetical protein
LFCWQSPAPKKRKIVFLCVKRWWYDDFFRGGGILLLYVYIQGGHKSRRATGIIWIRWCVSRQCTSVRNKCIDLRPYRIEYSPALLAGDIYIL